MVQSTVKDAQNKGKAVTLPVQGADPPLRLLATFQQIYPALEPTHIIQAPGRDMWVAASIAQSNAFTIHASDMDGHTSFSRRTAKNYRTVLKRPLPRWARYPAGVVLTLSASGLDVEGMDAVVVSEESPGPRYDYALGMTFAALIHSLHGQSYDSDGLLEIVEKVRREYVEGQ